MCRVTARKTKLGKRIIEGLTELVESVEKSKPVGEQVYVRKPRLRLKNQRQQER